MRCFIVICVGVIGSVLLGACGAYDDGPWSAATTVDDVSVYFRSALTFTGDGHAVASLDGTGDGELTRIVVAGPGASTFAEIGRGVLLAEPAAFGRAGVAYLRARPLPRGQSFDELAPTRLGVSLGTVPGSLGRWQPLARIASADVTAAIAADPRGDIAAAWFESRGGHTLLRVALRSAGHAFSRPMTLAEAWASEGDSLALAYGANGDLVVVFQRSRVRDGDNTTIEIAARVKRADGRFGAIQSLGPSRGFSSIASAVGSSGAAVVAWGTHDGGEGRNEPWTVRAATLRPGAHRFARTELLDSKGVAYYPVADVNAAVGSDTTATVLWSGIEHAKDASLQYPVRVATARAGRRFGRPIQIARNGAALGVVAAPDATTTVLWGSRYGDRQGGEPDPASQPLARILASRRAAGARRFAAPEPVSPDKPSINDGALALNPRSGHPSALWIGAHTTACDLTGDDCPVDALYSTRND